MKVVRLDNYSHGGNTYKNVDVFFDLEDRLILLPTLYSLSSRVNLNSFDTVIVLNDKRELQEQERISSITDSTVDSYIGPIKKYLSYLEGIDQAASAGNPSILHGVSGAPEDFINHYINKILSPTVNNIVTMGVHISALVSLYGWMWHGGLCKLPKLKLDADSTKAVAWRTGSADKINYISRAGRELLKGEANKSSLRDYILLLTGWDVGLRTKENQGLLLNDFVTMYGKCKGINSLIKEMKNNKNKLTFQYKLQGEYTKGGKSRDITFTREILGFFARYISGERATQIARGKEIAENREAKRIDKLSKGQQASDSIIEFVDHDSLFVNSDSSYAGKPIAKGCASKVFSKLLKRVNKNPLNQNITKKYPLNPNLSYHDCRHTFATELFHAMYVKKGSEIATLLEVAARLGHATFNGQPSNTTRRYVRLHGIMLSEGDGL